MSNLSKNVIYQPTQNEKKSMSLKEDFLAAMVVGENEEKGISNLIVFSNVNMSPNFVANVKQGKKPGNWMWPGTYGKLLLAKKEEEAKEE